MKTIKVFLASSDELAHERLQFSDLFIHLNHVLIPYGICLDLSKWEYLDSSMGLKHKQQEYNDELKTCEMCIVMFWTKFGEYTNEELLTAYNELKEGRNPKKLYVFFKEPAEMSDELKTFKGSFAKELGHFYCKFENVDSMRLHFLLQLEAYKSTDFKEFIKVENSNVTVDGNAMVNLDNIPFAARNKEYRRLKDEIAKTDSEIRAFEGILAAGPNDVISSLLGQKRTDLHKLKEELSNHEQLLFDTAKRIVQQQGERISERMSRAIEAFEDGRTNDANTILDEALHDARVLKEEIRRTEDILKHQRENAAISISELLFKASVVLTYDSMAIKDRINVAEEHFEEAYSLANECNYDTEKYIELLKKYTEFLNTFAKFEKCLNLNEELLDLSISFLGKNHSDVAIRYNNIGSVYLSLGKYEDALQHFEKALEIWLDIIKENHPIIATSYNNIGSVYLAQGMYEKALEYHEKALKIRQDVLGEKHLDVSVSYNNIGLGYFGQGKYEEALEYHNKALRIRLDSLGEKNLHVARSYNNIGLTYEALKKYGLALEYNDKALKIRLEILGEEHLDVAQSYNNIGSVFYSQEKYRRALVYHKRALEIMSGILKEEQHPDIATSYNNIGLAYYYLGEYDIALENLKKVVKIRSEVLGENNPNVATDYNSIGLIYSSLEEYGKALEYYEMAQKIRLEILNEKHPDILTSYHNVGVTYYKLREYDKSLEHLEKLLTIMLDTKGEEDPNTKEIVQMINYIRAEQYSMSEGNLY